MLALIAVWAMAPTPSTAAADYALNLIDIEAPAPLVKFLRANLSLPAADPPLDKVQRLRLGALARKQSADLLATEGYFNAQAEIAKDGGEHLRLVVTPGPRAMIAFVDLDFNGAIAQGEEGAARMATLRAAWRLPVGQPFRQRDWDDAKDALRQALLDKDYAAARLEESRAEVDSEAATVRLSLRIDSGPAFTLGALDVHGLERYDRELVERYSRIEPGERYSQERLLDLQRTLQNTPYFSSVRVSIDHDPTQAERVPVQISVVEARAKRVSFGAGYSSNNGPRAQATYSDANIIGRGWLLDTGLRIDARGQVAFADLHLPPTRKDYRDSFGLLDERHDNQGLFTNRLALGAVRAQTRGSIETQRALNWQREQREVDEGGTSTSQALVLSYAWTKRAVDNVLDPRRGYVIGAQIGGAARGLMSDRSFIRTTLRSQRYWTVFQRDVFTLRADAGWTAATTRDGVPEEYLFRAGGAQSVRGYSYQSLGVREGSAIVGGRYLFSAGAEYVRWITPEWGAALFVDAGNAADQPQALFPLRRSLGIGARWRSPAGPLAFDLAYAEHDHKIRPVFSIAIAF